MSSKTDTQVIIGGKVYILSGYESEEYLQKVAAYINNKLNEYGKLDSFRRQPQEMQNVLMYLNIADDYFKAKKQITSLEEELESREKELYDVKHELISGQVKSENMERQEAQYRQEMELKDARIAALEELLGKSVEVQMTLPVQTKDQPQEDAVSPESENDGTKDVKAQASESESGDTMSQASESEAEDTVSQASEGETGDAKAAEQITGKGLKERPYSAERQNGKNNTGSRKNRGGSKYNR